MRVGDIIKLNLIFLLLIFFLLSVSEVTATTYYVAPSGLDSSLGTKVSPFKTIQKCADIMMAGDTCVVRDGIYTDMDMNNSVVRITKSGTASDWITFKSENKWGAIIDGQDDTSLYGFLLARGPNYIKIKDFEIFDMKSTGIHSNSASSNIHINGNKIHHIGSKTRFEPPKDATGIASKCYGKSGIFEGVGGKFHIYKNNMFYSNGRLETPGGKCNFNHDHGIYTQGTNSEIVNNIFYDHDNGWGIQISPQSDTVNIINNTFSGPNLNQDGHIVLWGQHSIGYPDNITIQNNIFNNSKNSSVYCAGASGSTNIILKNNLSTSGNSLITYSRYCNGLEVIKSDNFVGDPGFANESANDYSLTSRSIKVLNSGALENAPLLDFSKNFRSGLPDLGALEYLAPSDVVPKVIEISVVN